MKIVGRARAGRLLLAFGIAAAVFGIATAVQASIPDASGVIHGCYNTSLAHGNPTGALRVIDTSKINGNCASWEAPLNWNAKGVTGATGATGPTGARGPTGPTGPGGVIAALGPQTFTALSAGEYVLSETCPVGSTANPVYGSASVTPAYTQRDNFNNGMVASATPDNNGTMHFALSATSDVTLYGSCVTPSAFGLAPVRGKPTLTVTKTG